MWRGFLAAVVLCLHSNGGWFRDETVPPPEMSELWRQFRNRFPATEAAARRWAKWGADRLSDAQELFDFSAGTQFELNLWLIADSVFGFMGWAVFGSAWGGVRTRCRRLIQISAVLVVCLIGHYLWSVCYPIVSILLALVMAVVWLLRRLLRCIGTVFFYAQKWTGGAPEAADAEFHGPGTGAVPETTALRSFKRTGDNPKRVVVRRGEEVAVFLVGLVDSQTIRTHGLYLPVDPDSVRSTPALVRRLKYVDKVHLCRNLACTKVLC